jgi:hypothetical protein
MRVPLSAVMPGIGPFHLQIMGPSTGQTLSRVFSCEKKSKTMRLFWDSIVDGLHTLRFPTDILQYRNEIRGSHWLRSSQIENAGPEPDAWFPLYSDRLSAMPNEASAIEFGDGLANLFLRIHHDRAVPRNRFFDRFTRDEQEPNAFRASLDGDLVAAIEQDE